ncbi:MAG TPA: hypothetical protein VHD85_07425 [Terracidiphilus sp.]|nr:hypothetical protein [Terracidiphilus sp.]
MELLDRYLQQVKRHLPWLRQDDIIAELRTNLESQLEDKEAELGRPLTEAEVESWLKQMGPPIHVAARYMPQQHLIGPTLFPIYWYVLRLTLAWCAILYIIAKVAEEVASGVGPQAALHAIVQLPWVLLVNAAIVTFVFAAIERIGKGAPQKLFSFLGEQPAWPQGVVSPFDASLDESDQRRSYAHAVAEVIFGWLFLVWLLLVPHYPFLWLGPGVKYFAALPYALASVWWTFYWCVVALNGIELMWRITDLLRGYWRGPRRAQRLVMRTVGLVPLIVLLNAPERVFVLLKHPAIDAAAHGETVAQINTAGYRAFEVVTAILLLQLIWMIVRMSLDAYRKRLAAAR